MTIGESLKRARKKLNLELDEIAERTKIAKMFLIALENDDISSLPSGVYARNFLRTYARYLQLDEDILTAEYHEQYQVKPHFVAHQEQTKLDDRQFRLSRRRFILGFFIFIAVLAAALYWFLSRSDTSLTAWLQGGLQEIREVVSGKDSQPGTAAATPAFADDPAAATAGDVPTYGDLPGATSDPGVQALATSGESGTGDRPASSPLETEQAPLAAGGTTLQTLPVDHVNGIPWSEPDRPAEVLTDMFALAARGEAWVEVVIDGRVITQRILTAGQVRFYRYGSFNSIKIGDAGQVAVQDGESYREVIADRPYTVFAEGFGPGELLEAIDRAIKRTQSPKE